MIRTDAEWLRRLADLVEAGEIEVGRVETSTSVLLGTLQPGTLALKELADDFEEVSRVRARRRRLR